jgi:hypothetical protein
MTFEEASYAVRCLPAEATARLQDAADEADKYWRRMRCTRAQLIMAKAVAVEVSLISSGALLHIAGMR